LFEPASGAGKGTDEAFATLMTCSGFPEPFLSGREVRYRRWAAGYHRQIVRNDIRDAFAVHDIDTMEALYALLIPRAGSPLSIAQLTDPLKTSHKTIGSWLSVFERLCLVFRVRPYSRRIHRSLLKAPKVYFYDYCRIADVAKRFENLVAVELRRAATNWTDYGLGDFDLFYLRNKEQEEVDFLVTRDGAPFFMVEVKLADLDVSEALKKFQAVLHVPAVQLVRKPGTDRVFRSGADRVLLTDAAGWLSRLG
jgi:predicted AAA+ superfamily ATPase